MNQWPFVKRKTEATPEVIAFPVQIKREQPVDYDTLMACCDVLATLNDEQFETLLRIAPAMRKDALWPGIKTRLMKRREWRVCWERVRVGSRFQMLAKPPSFPWRKR